MSQQTDPEQQQPAEKTSRRSSRTTEMHEPKEDGTENVLNDESTADDEEYATGAPLAALTLSLILGMFIVALDNTILGVAIPKITDEFKDLNKVSWYGAAYFMTFGGSFQSTWGKVFKYYPLKLWYLIAMFIFEVGSLICGVAQDPTTLIVGRAIAGLGGSGVAVGVFTILGFAAHPAKRPQLLGFTGAAYGTSPATRYLPPSKTYETSTDGLCVQTGIAAVLGPLIGGAFTDKVTWRWCFYINLPIGGVAAVIGIIFFKPSTRSKPAQATRKEKLLQLDLIGAALMMSLIVSYILALQYGGQTHSWKSSIVVGLLVGFVAILMVFIAWEIYQKERAMIVPRLFMKRYVSVGALYMFFFGGAYFTILYYLPIYFQSVKDSSPIGSGVNMLALILPLTVAVIIQGAALSKIGLVPLFWIGGGALATVGCGLLYTLDGDTSTGKWVGYQIIIGVASGWTFQTSSSTDGSKGSQRHSQTIKPDVLLRNPSSATLCLRHLLTPLLNALGLINAQVHAKPEDMSQVTAIVNFFVTVGGSFFISAAQCAFNNQLIKQLTINLPSIDPVAVLGIGATEIRQHFTHAQLPIVLDAYTIALKAVFAITVAAYGISTCIGCFGSWKKLHPEELQKTAGGAA